MSEAQTVRCPFCDAASAELLSLFGSQLLLSQYRCGACGSYFEGVRPDRWDTEPLVPRGGHPVPRRGEKEDGG